MLSVPSHAFAKSHLFGNKSSISLQNREKNPIGYYIKLWIGDTVLKLDIYHSFLSMQRASNVS